MIRKENITNNIQVRNNYFEVLKSNFPHCFDKDGKFDFAKFQKELKAKNVEFIFEKESYGE